MYVHMYIYTHAHIRKHAKAILMAPLAPSHRGPPRRSDTWAEGTLALRDYGYRCRVATQGLRAYVKVVSLYGFGVMRT